MKKGLSFAIIGMVIIGLIGCANYDYRTTGPGSREVNAVLILDQVTPEIAKIRQKVLFDFDSYKLDTVARSTVKSVAALMKEYPDTDLVIQGYTDKYGSDEYNMNLSLQRANAVKAALIADGVQEERIVEIEGFGKTQLIPNVSNRENRRVLILSVGE